MYEIHIHTYLLYHQSSISSIWTVRMCAYVYVHTYFGMYFNWYIRTYIVIIHYFLCLNDFIGTILYMYMPGVAQETFYWGATLIYIVYKLSLMSEAVAICWTTWVIVPPASLFNLPWQYLFWRAWEDLRLGSEEKDG